MNFNQILAYCLNSCKIARNYIDLLIDLKKSFLQEYIHSINSFFEIAALVCNYSIFLLVLI